MITGPASLCIGAIGVYTNPNPAGTWSSSNTVHLTIDASGDATAHGSGLTTISYTYPAITYDVTTSGGTTTYCTHVTMLTDTFTVTVMGAVPGIKYLGVVTTNLTINVGQSVTLVENASGYSWVSSDTGVATVTTGVSGLFLSSTCAGIGVGTCTITYTAASGCTAVLNLTVV